MTTPRVLVVGAGPAGISAALWLRDLAIPFAWWSAGPVGGTLRRVGNPVLNYPGYSAPRGDMLVEQFISQLDALQLAPECDVELRGLERTDLGWRACRDAGDLVVDAVILATGTRPRMLGLPGERSWLGRGVELSVTRRREDYRGQEVVVAGGGDAALEGALLLHEVGCRVHVVHRGQAFRAQQRFIDAVEDAERIHTHFNREVVGFEANERMESVTLDDGEVLQARGLFERIGVAPAVPPGVPEGALLRSGYLRVTTAGRVSESGGGVFAGLYAAGDVMDPEHQSVAWSAGTAARAVASIRFDLEALDR